MPRAYQTARLRAHSLGVAPGKAIEAVLSSGRPPGGPPLWRGEEASRLSRPQRLDEPVVE